MEGGKPTLAAATDNSPKLAFFPELCETTPSFTSHSLVGTCHCCAAAPTSIARALAPASRMGSHRSLMLVEPPVNIRPISRMALRTNHCALLFTMPWLSG